MKQTVAAQLFKKCPAFCETRRFVTVLTKACHWTLFCTGWIQSTPSHSV